MDWLQGKQVALTGKLASMTHAEAADLLGAHGAQLAAAVNRQTDFLIVGQESWPLQNDGRLTNPLQKAEELQQAGCPIVILAEEELLSRLGLQVDGVHRRYTLSQLIELLGVPRNRMRAWMRAGLIHPVEKQHGISYFNFRQVTGVKTLCDLANAGISTERLRLSLQQLKLWVNDVDQPLEQLALLEKNGQLLVRLDGGLVAPSGQMYFDFVEDSLRETSAGLAERILHHPITGEQWFESGRLFEEEGDAEQAAHAYRQALLVAGPDADVCFNLANVLYAMGHKEEASERYRQVIELDRGHAEAWNNLGVVLADLRDAEAAIEAFQRAIELHYVDAHYTLADHLHSLGRTAEARVHWQMYVRHDPHGPWGRFARGQLG